MTLLTETQHASEIVLDSKVSEIGPLDTATVDIPVDQKWLEKLRARDDNPQFVTVYVEAGKSKSGYKWSPEILKKIAKQVNEKRPCGYKGHIPDNEDNTAFPTIHTNWVGAKVVEEGGSVRLYLKGYNRNTEIREEVELGMIDSVSVRGDCSYRPVVGGYEVLDAEIESIDWSRKGRNGMPSRVVSITSEMEGGNTVEAKDIAALDESEVRQHAPLLVKEIERKATEPLQTKVTEMEQATETAQENADTVKTLCDKLGVDDKGNLIDSVTALLTKVEEVAEKEVKDFIKDAIKKIVPSETGQKLVARLGIVSEMESKFSALDDDAKKEIEDGLKVAVEDDEDMKAIISEMKIERPSTGGAGLGSRRAPSGDKTEDGVVKDNDNLTVEEVPL